ncbi:unnamed protein product [Rotaria sp. Silwood1]|nr:unnamed protein product [Rotaria sp. Silwood1]
MPDPLSVYVPLESLTKQTIESVALTALKHEMPDWNHSRRTLLAFLLAINERLNEIEKNKIQYDEQTLKHAIKIRQWLVREEKSGQIIEFDWNELRKTYDNMINNKNNKKEMYLGMRNEEPYYELTINAEHPDIDQSRKYMARFRNNGWEPHELKVYWNVEQLEIMCPKDGQEVENERLPPHDPSDDDVVQALRQYPVSKRNHAGTITYINKGIEKAVFDVPKDAQIILLNFANECSPGGGYLWHACAQEEIILYNSDGYRALLDLKYGRMGGGYAIPEFGLAYVRDICFVDKDTEQYRQADMLVSACYCLVQPQLYDNPKTIDEWIEKNIVKFRAFISAAVANTKGDGSKTYLLLGPIGTGAFGNDVNHIGYVFRDVLTSKMMGSSGPISKVFNMSSDEEEFDDDTTDFDEFDTTDEDADDDDDDVNGSTSQPIHFRECLRLLDAALSTSNPPVLPRWCASEQIGPMDDPMLLINGHQRCLSLPLDKREARRFIRKAVPFDMKIDIVDGISFLPSSCQIPVNSFSILNPEWKTKTESYLKRSCVAPSLELDPNQIELKISNLILLEPCQFPRQFIWSKDEQNPLSIGKLFLSLPSTYKGGKETIIYQKEKHIFDLSEKNLLKSNFYTIVPISNECKHEIDYISDGYKLILIYDIIPLTSTIFYNVNINETIMIRVSKILDTWINGLEQDYHGYSTKIIIPFSDTYQLGNNPLLHGIDRVIGTILRRTIEQYYSNKFLLYQGIIQPNRSNDGTVHVCRLLTDLNLMMSIKTNTLFDKIDLCLGNCNETYSGNIFLRKTKTEQGNFISIEQFNVPIWCLVPVNHKYDLLIDNIPRVLTYLEQNLIPYHNQRNEIFSLINWLLTSTKKIHFNAKLLLHQLLPLLSDNTITYNLIIIIRQLFEHKKFLEQFFPMNNKQDYDDIIYLLNYSKDTKIQLYLHQVFRTVLKRRLRDTDRIHDAIKFIGILSTRNVNSNFIFVLIHELLSNIFKINNPIPSITDLANLLALLSLSIDSFQSSCQIISQQIIQQIKITTITTTNTSTITNLLRTVLVPTLIQIYRQFLNKNQLLRKRKRDSIINFPSWFISLYQTCLSLLNTYCNSNPPIPTYDNLSNIFDIYCCTICQQLFIFLQNTNRFEQTFIISKDKIDHFNMIVNKFNPLIIITKSMTSDKENYQINIIKMSTYDEEISRENNLLRSLLFHIQLSNHFEDQPDTMKKKRFKSSI